jgi:hypothetical protein
LLYNPTPFKYFIIDTYLSLAHGPINMTFHVGKVFTVIKPGEGTVSADDSVQATVEMWDGNLFTFDVKEGLEDAITDGAVVLIDYRPKMAGKTAIPDQEVVKVFGDKQGKQVWQRYQRFNQHRQNQGTPTNPIQPSYMG